jgi:hypothetical protein
MKYLFVVVCVFFAFSKSFAQYGVTIASGRPGNANGAGTVGQGVLQFQAGVQYDEFRDNQGVNEIYQSTFAENLVVRFGLWETIEVSTVINHQRTTLESTFNGDTDRNTFTGFNTTMLRARWAVVKNLAVQVGIDLPVLENDFKSDYPAPKIRVMYNAPFTENIALTTNLGAQWNGIEEDFTRDPVGFYVFSLSCGLPAKFSLILESYGNFTKTSWANSFDVGLGYLVNNDFLLDVNAGWGDNTGASTYFITAGVSYRMVTGFRKQK